MNSAAFLVRQSVHSPDIDDVYRYIEPDLVDRLKAGLSQHVEQPD